MKTKKAQEPAVSTSKTPAQNNITAGPSNSSIFTFKLLTTTLKPRSGPIKKISEKQLLFSAELIVTKLTSRVATHLHNPISARMKLL